MEAYTMQAKRGAGSRHTSRNIGGRVTHPAKEKQPPQATEGGQCAIGMQAATPMSDRVVTSHTHTHITTSPRHHHPGTSSPHHPDIITPAITLQGMEAMERGRDAAALTLVPVTPIPTSPPRHHHPDTSSYHPARCGSLHDAAALDNSLAPVPHIPPPAHHHPGTSSHRVITLQGVEALEPPRHHHRAIRMQHHTPMSDHHTKQPPSLWYQSHTYRPRHTTPPSYHRGRPLEPVRAATSLPRSIASIPCRVVTRCAGVVMMSG